MRPTNGRPCASACNLTKLETRQERTKGSASAPRDAPCSPQQCKGENSDEQPFGDRRGRMQCQTDNVKLPKTAVVRIVSCGEGAQQRLDEGGVVVRVRVLWQ